MGQKETYEFLDKHRGKKFSSREVAEARGTRMGQENKHLLQLFTYGHIKSCIRDEGRYKPRVFWVKFGKKGDSWLPPILAVIVALILFIVLAGRLMGLW